MTIIKFIPSLLTGIGLCFGITSIKFIMVAKYQTAIKLLLVSLIFDMLDGRIARVLDASTFFGKQLDTLSDMCCFGVCPAILLYSISLKEISLGWISVLLYVICSVYRLARFNTAINENGKHFIGMPVPMAAATCVVPLLFCTPNPYIMMGILWIASLLMVSRYKTYSAKKLPFYRCFFYLVLPLLMSIFVGVKWIMLLCMCIYYWISIILNSAQRRN